MSQRICYLASPKDQVPTKDSPVNVEEWRGFAMTRLREEQFCVYNAVSAWSANGEEPDWRVQSVNLAALDAADCGLAFLPRGIRSTGVPMEIERLRARGKPVAVVGSITSWALEGADGERRLVRQFSKIGAAVEWLRGQESATGDGMALNFTGEGQLPQKAYPGDAGWDLFVSEDCEIGPQQFKDVPCGLSVELPAGHWAMIHSRSSALRKLGLLVSPGIIDEGYRGELFAGVFNLRLAGPVRLRKGDRIAQLIVFSNPARNWVPMRVGELSKSERGVAGFGSSGR